MFWYDLPGLLPTVYRKIKQMSEIAITEDIELRGILDKINQILNNFFVQTCDLKTLEIFESLFGIIPDPDSSEDERRAIVLSYFRAVGQFTLPWLKEQLNAAIGVDKWELIPNYNNQSFVLIAEKLPPSLVSLIGRTKPAHVLFGTTVKQRVEVFVGCRIRGYSAITFKITFSDEKYEVWLDHLDTGGVPAIRIIKSFTDKLPNGYLNLAQIKKIVEDVVAGIPSKVATVNNQTEYSFALEFENKISSECGGIVEFRRI